MGYHSALWLMTGVTVAGIASLGCGGSPPEPESVLLRVTFEFTDSVPGNPVLPLDIAVNGNSGLTGPDGMFVALVPPGSMHLSVEDTLNVLLERL